MNQYKLVSLNLFLIFNCLFITVTASVSTVLPKNNSVLYSNEISFLWNEYPNALNYTIEISDDSSFNNIIETQVVFSNDYQTTSLQSGEKYFWHILPNNSSWSKTLSFRLIDIKNIPNISLWLNPDSNIVVDVSDKVLEWENTINSSNSFAQGNSSRQPLLINNIPELNNKAVIRFNGLSDFLDGGDILDVDFQSVTYFLFGKISGGSTATFFSKTKTGTGNNRYNLRMSSNELKMFYFDINRFDLSFGAPSSEYSIYGSRIDRTNRTLESFVNNLTIDSKSGIQDENYNFSSSWRFLLGALNVDNANSDQQDYLNGDIAEVIFVNEALNDSLNKLIGQYFRYKYTPPVNLGLDVNIVYGFCDTVISAEKDWFTNYLWNTGESSSSIIVSSPGIYSVTVTDLLGNHSTDSLIVTYPQGNTPLKDTSLCLGDTIIIDSGFGNNYSFNWSNFSTGNTLTINQSGIYSLTVTDSFFCESTDTFSVSVDSFNLDINLGPNLSICAGNSIKLISGKSNIASYLWSDGSSDSSLQVYTTGNYSLTVENSNGCLASDSIDVTIIGTAPTVSFSFDSVCFSEPTSFQNQSSAINPDTITNYTWFFSSDTITNIENPQKVLTQNGVNYVTLSATTNSGCSASSTMSVFVRPLPNTEFDILYDACTNTPYSFIGKTDVDLPDSIVNVLWDFGDFNFAVGDSVGHIYQFDGTYNVELTAETKFGCSFSESKQINVLQNSSVPTPNACRLIFPSNNFVGSENILIFKWDYNINSFKYKLDIALDSQFSNTIYSKVFFNETSDTVNSLFTGEYYWRITSYNICNDSSLSVVNKFTILNLMQNPNTILWLSADDNRHTRINGNNELTSWVNSIDTNISFLPPLGSEPSFIQNVSELNNKPVIRFDGISDFLDGGDVLDINYGSRSFFLVGKINGSTCTYFSKTRTSSGNNRYNLRLANNDLGMFYFDATRYDLSFGPAKTNYSIISSLIDRDSSLLRSNVNGSNIDLIYGINGSSYDFSSSWRFLIGALNIDNSNNSQQDYLNGDIAEIIFIDEILNDSTRNLVEQYLRYKYAPPVNLGPDIYVNYGFCDTVISAQKDWFTSYLWNTGDTTSTINVNSSGIYSVTVTDIFGFSSVDNVEVYYPNSSLVNDSTICLNDTLFYNTQINTSIYNNFTWNDGNTSSNRQITNAGFYYYSVDDTNGCSFTSDTLFVSVDSFALNNLLVDSISLCEGNILEVIDTSNIISYTWSSGSNLMNTVVIDSGYYKITATNINSCVALDSTYVNIKGTAPTVNFTTGTNCEEVAVNFTDQSTSTTGNVTSWQWDFGDQSFSSNQNPSHVYDAMGSFNVSLVVETDSGCVGATNQTITIQPKPIANFTYETTCVGQPVPFQELSAPPVGSFITDRKWYFGNSDSANVMNPVVNYDSSGVYMVSLISSAANGCYDTITKSVEVYPAINPAIEADNLCLGNDAQFYDASPNHSNIDWIWDFGGDGSSRQKDPIHRFSLSGQYSISLTVTNAVGCTENVSKLITVAETPIVDFASSNSCPDLPVSFSDLTQVVLGDSIIERIWTFGDSSYLSRLPNPTHTYSDTGSYTVSLLVKTSLGCNATTTKSVSVIPGPTASFDFNPTFGGAPLEVKFNNKSTGASFYEWDFGDGSQTNTDFNPTHTYEEEGEYVIKLITESDAGCTDNFYGNIYVTDALYDLIILDLETEKEIINDCSYDLATTVSFANQGTLPISAIRFSLRLNEKTTISEVWEGDLQPGAVAVYTFTSKANVLDCDGQYYVCVEATYPDGNSDQTPFDNKNCSSVLSELVISNLYPNPASDIISLDIIAPNKDKISIELVGVNGANLGKILDQEIPAGYSHFNFDVSTLETGLYFLDVKYKEEIISKKFVILE